MSIPRNISWPRLACLWLGLAAAAPTWAQATAYRCSDGSYSQSPCPGGRALDVPPAPTAEQQRDAKAAADRDARLAEQLKKERLVREQEAARRQAANAGHERAGKKASAKDSAKPAAKSASGPGKGKGQKSGKATDRIAIHVEGEPKRKAASEKRAAKAAAN